MTKWYLGVDETGNFAWDGKPESSFALAVVVSESDYEKLEDLYRKAYSELKFGTKQDPDKLKIKEILKYFHYMPKENVPPKEDSPGYTEEQKEFLLDCFVPRMFSVIRSTGKPASPDNQQGWWLRAVEAVIQGFFDHEVAEPNDEICIQMDSRARKVLGLIDEKKTSQEKHNESMAYHDEKARYLTEKFSRPTGTFSVQFTSDDDSVLVNVADLACRLLKDRKLKSLVSVYRVNCSQPLLTDVAGLLKSGAYRAAIEMILKQCCNGEFSQLRYLPQIFSDLSQGRGQTDERKHKEYCAVWREICDFYEEYLECRGDIPDIIPHLAQLRDALEPEMNKKLYTRMLPAADRLDFLEHLIGLETHLGTTEDRYGEKYQELLRQEPPKRASERKEKRFRLQVRRAQFYFHAYQFTSVREQLERSWEEQEEAYKKDQQGPDLHDLSLAEIYGTLAQSYAFEGNYEEAIEYFKQDFTVASEEDREKVTAYLSCSY